MGHCRRVRSITSFEKIREWQSTHLFPQVVSTRVPSSRCFIYEPGVGWLVVFKAQLECGLRFPPHPFFRALASSHELVMNQFTRHISAFITLSLLFGIEPLVSTFLQFYKIMPKAMVCFYYLGPRGSNTIKYHFMWKCLGSRKGWH